MVFPKKEASADKDKPKTTRFAWDRTPVRKEKPKFSFPWSKKTPDKKKPKVASQNNTPLTAEKPKVTSLPQIILSPESSDSDDSTKVADFPTMKNQAQNGDFDDDESSVASSILKPKVVSLPVELAKDQEEDEPKVASLPDLKTPSVLKPRVASLPEREDSDSSEEDEPKVSSLSMALMEKHSQVSSDSEDSDSKEGNDSEEDEPKVASLPLDLQNSPVANPKESYNPSPVESPAQFPTPVSESVNDAPEDGWNSDSAADPSCPSTLESRAQSSTVESPTQFPTPVSESVNDATEDGWNSDSVADPSCPSTLESRAQSSTVESRAQSPTPMLGNGAPEDGWNSDSVANPSTMESPAQSPTPVSANGAPEEGWNSDYVAKPSTVENPAQSPTSVSANGAPEEGWNSDSSSSSDEVKTTDAISWGFKRDASKPPRPLLTAKEKKHRRKEKEKERAAKEPPPPPLELTNEKDTAASLAILQNVGKFTSRRGKEGASTEHVKSEAMSSYEEMNSSWVLPMKTDIDNMWVNPARPIEHKPGDKPSTQSGDDATKEKSTIASSLKGKPNTPVGQGGGASTEKSLASASSKGNSALQNKESAARSKVDRSPEDEPDDVSSGDDEASIRISGIAGSIRETPDNANPTSAPVVSRKNIPAAARKTTYAHSTAREMMPPPYYAQPSDPTPVNTPAPPRSATPVPVSGSADSVSSEDSWVPRYDPKKDAEKYGITQDTTLQIFEAHKLAWDTVVPPEKEKEKDTADRSLVIEDTWMPPNTAESIQRVKEEDTKQSSREIADIQQSLRAISEVPSPLEKVPPRSKQAVSTSRSGGLSPVPPSNREIAKKDAEKQGNTPDPKLQKFEAHKLAWDAVVLPEKRNDTADRSLVIESTWMPPNTAESIQRVKEEDTKLSSREIVDVQQSLRSMSDVPALPGKVPPRSKQSVYKNRSRGLLPAPPSNRKIPVQGRALLPAPPSNRKIPVQGRAARVDFTGAVTEEEKDVHGSRVPNAAAMQSEAKVTTPETVADGQEDWMESCSDFSFVSVSTSATEPPRILPGDRRGLPSQPSLADAMPGRGLPRQPSLADAMLALIDSVHLEHLEEQRPASKPDTSKPASEQQTSKPGSNSTTSKPTSEIASGGPVAISGQNNMAKRESPNTSSSTLKMILIGAMLLVGSVAIAAVLVFFLK
jgi:hypothetical protein